jgi:rRNA maturation RNase YbeY
LKIEFNFEAENRKFIYSKSAQKLICKLIESEKKKLGEISFVFTDNQAILNINREFLKHHYFTDVITFNYSMLGILKGDIYISLEQVAKNAKKYQTTALEELFRVIIHGTLHLIGYIDVRAEDRKKMKIKEDEYLCMAREIINLDTDELIL